MAGMVKVDSNQDNIKKSMREVGILIMAQNDMDLLTDNLNSLREGLLSAEDETVVELTRRSRHGLDRVNALVSSAGSV